MARLARAGTLCALITTLTFGCSDSNDGSLSRQEFVAAAVGAECADFGACCALDGHPYDEAFCHAQTTAVLEARIANPAVQYDGERAAQCVRALRASPGECDVTREELEACGAIFRGTKPPGAPCTDPWECAGYPGEGYCSLPFPGETPVCVTPVDPPSYAGPGQACAGTCRIDDRSSSCTYAGPAPEGAAVCLTSDGLFCDPTSDTCVPLLTPGSACERGSAGCPDGTFCDGALCVPSRGEGESCLIDFCDAFSCPSPTDEACVAPLVCPFDFDDARCTRPRPDGDPCTSSRECASLWCEQECGESGCAPGFCKQPERTDRDFCAGTVDEEAASGETLQTRADPPARPANEVRPVLRWAGGASQH